MVSSIVKWCRYSSFEFAAAFQDAIVAAIPTMVDLLRDQNWEARQVAASSLAEFAQHGE
jgi:HEAT repeat protein